MVLILDNHSNTCRCCMNSDMTLNMFKISDHSLVKLFFKCTSLEIEEGDGLPEKICESCHIKLIEYNEFILMCKHSDSSFREYINTLNQSSSTEAPFELKTESTENSNETITKSREIQIQTIESNEDGVIIEETENDADVNQLVKKEECHNAHNDCFVEDEDIVTGSESGEDESKLFCETKTTEDEKCDNNPDKLEIKLKQSNSSGEKSPKAIFPCTICDKKFYRERRLEGHLRQHQGLKPAVCSLCGKEFAKWGGLDTHITYAHKRLEKQFICDEPKCGKTYMMKQSLTTHKKRAHSKATGMKTESCYICELCGKSFSSNATLKKHTFTHTGLRPFKCTLCPKTYITNHKLKEHMMRHQGIKNFICPVCGMKKTTMHELKVHMNYHTREKLYPCKMCTLIFSSPGNRGRHYRIVHCGIKAYQCTHCDRSFGKAETLKHHIMTHTGEKPHGCSVCGKRFIQLVALQTHTRTHNKSR